MSTYHFTSGQSFPGATDTVSNPYRSRAFVVEASLDRNSYKTILSERKASMEESYPTAPSSYRSSSPFDAEIQPSVPQMRDVYHSYRDERLPLERQAESNFLNVDYKPLQVASMPHLADDKEEAEPSGTKGKSSILAKRRRPSLSVNLNSVQRASVPMIFPNRTIKEIEGKEMFQDNHASRAGYLEFIRG